jgi:AraC family transcriptional regulator, regulatory protein of adaptative response / methylated-DNA-[protein]-cysteine methyltransferase
LYQEPQSDYAKVQDLLVHLTENWREQPSLEELSSHMRMDEQALQRLFLRWAGLTPKAFLQVLTLNHARAMLADSASVFEAALDSGLSGPSRLHDLFVTHEAMPPGIWKAKGEGLTICYGWHSSPFGRALVMITDYGLCGLAFADEGGEAAAFEDMRRRWPNAQYTEDIARTTPFANRIFANECWKANDRLRVTLIGTDFEIRVWEGLLKIPMGKATTYGTLAQHIGKPKAARAVGAAVGKNPISFVVPCHRVIGKSGELTGYHWGLNRKRAMLGWEAGRVMQ